MSLRTSFAEAQLLLQPIQMTGNSIRQACSRLLLRVVIPFRRIRLCNRAVSLISNDCWSSFMYQFYRIPFNSPFAGLFIMPDDYLHMLEHPDILSQPIIMGSASDSRHRAALAHLPEYPLGFLPGGVEIHFLHYKSQDEAREKWTRRVSRIDWNNAIVKLSENNGCTEGHLRRFDALPYRCKVAFTSRPYPGLESVCTLREFSGEEQLGRYWKIAELHWSVGRHANRLLRSISKKD